MFYYSQQLILAELVQHQNGQGLDDIELEDQDDFVDSSIIFELSQSYIQPHDNNQHEQNNIENHNQQNENIVGQFANGNQDNNVNANEQNQFDHFQEGQINQDHQNLLNLNNLGLFYLVVNRWLSNLADPVLQILFFLSGFVNSQSINGTWSDFLKYSNFVVGACCVVTNLINILRLIKGKREQILLPLPQNPPQEEVRNAYSQEKFQQNFNNIYYVCMISISIIQVISMIQNSKYEDNIYQRYLLLIFIYLRVVMYLVYYMCKHPKTTKKLLMYCVTAWPVYRKEFDEYICYNFDFAIQIQTNFAKDPVQNYLKFMIYIYEFILVLQIIAFGSSWQKDQLVLQEYSYFFGAFYYISIIYIALFNYYIVTQNVHLSAKMNRVKNSAFLIVFFSSYTIFIILQLISALVQDTGKQYYILQFEPIFAFYLVCISCRIVLNRITLKTLNQEIKKQIKLQQQQNLQQLENSSSINSSVSIEISSVNQHISVIELSRNNSSNRIAQQNQSNQNPNISSNNQNVQIDQISNISVNNQNVFNANNQNQQNLNINNGNNSNINNNINNINNNNNRMQEEQVNHFQDMKRKIRQMIAYNSASIDKNINLIVNFEGYTITISLALQLFVYMFSDNLEIYEQNSTICNFYYFLSIYSFMFYFLCSKKVSLAYDKLKNQSDPFSLYWIIPFQSYLNKLGWQLSWILSFVLIYLYFNINFISNSFVKAEYIFMIFFSITTFFIFQIIHLIRRIMQPKQAVN